MEITHIKECGSSNLLKWALDNGADIANDLQLESLINDELFYQITISNVNFFELFRLTQMYREKIHVIGEQKAEIPDANEIVNYLPSNVVIDDKEFDISEAVQHASDMFIKLVTQMTADDNIIQPDTVRLFIPMVCRKFEIEIPMSFMDLMSLFDEENTPDKLLNENYPDNLDEVIIGSTTLCNKIMLHLFRSTRVIRYDGHYDQLLRLTKYAPLRKCEDDKLYKFRLCGLIKYNKISRNEYICSFFNTNKVAMAEGIKKLESIKSPLKLDFVVQLPLQYMQMLENSFSPEELGITYESSISDIIDTGLSFNNFITQEFDETTEQDKIESYNNAIDLYKVRISDANKTTLGLIQLLLNQPDLTEADVDKTYLFSMLPSIYSTKAVIRVNTENIDKYLSHYNAVIRSMFQEMLDIAKSVTN